MTHHSVDVWIRQGEKQKPFDPHLMGCAWLDAQAYSQPAIAYCMDKPMKNDEKCTDQASASKEKQLLSMKFADWCKLHQITIMNHNQSIYKVYKMQPHAKSCPASSAQYSQLFTLRQWLSNCIGTNFMPQGDALHRIEDLWSKVVCQKTCGHCRHVHGCIWLHCKHQTFAAGCCSANGAVLFLLLLSDTIA